MSFRVELVGLADDGIIEVWHGVRGPLPEPGDSVTTADGQQRPVHHRRFLPRGQGVVLTVGSSIDRLILGRGISGQDVVGVKLWKPLADDGAVPLALFRTGGDDDDRG